MLKFHEVIRPIFSQSFFDKTIDLWLHKNSGHIGPDMYQDHAAYHQNKSMSGTKTWETYAKQGILPKLEKQAFSKNYRHLSKHIPQGTPIIEFGPGAMLEAKSLIQTINPDIYTPVDCSLQVITQSKNLAKTTQGCIIQPAITDFLSQNSHPLSTKRSLGALLGLTLGNLSCPIPHKEPKKHLTLSLQNIIKTMPHGGAFYISVDTCLDKETNINRYNEPSHRRFSLNHLHRMQHELPMRGFNPNNFLYKPSWHEEANLLAHSIIAKKDLNFFIGKNDEYSISVHKGEIFHCDNSFKYSHDFFEECAAEAGLSVIERWQEEDSTICMYLFDVPAKIEEATAPQITQERYGTNHNYYETDNAQIAI